MAPTDALRTDGSEGIGTTYAGLADRTCPDCSYHTAHRWTDGARTEYACTECGA